MTVTLDEAIAMIVEKSESEAKKVIKSFEEEPEIEIMNGRFGLYIAYKGTNYKIARTFNPQDLTLEQCHEIIAAQDAKPQQTSRRRTQRAAKK